MQIQMPDVTLAHVEFVSPQSAQRWFCTLSETAQFRFVGRHWSAVVAHSKGG
jgi:hypothetical protein